MPDFRIQPNSFPIASVIDAAQRNNQLQEQARQSGNQALITGLQSIGQIGQSLFDQKVKVAQALAGAHMVANTPEGQQMLGTNQVASTAEGPVTQNQTASYDPSTGATTPLKSPVDVRTIATALYGASPKDLLEHMTQAQAAKMAQGELALKQQTEPQRLAIEARKATAEEENAKMQRLFQGLLANNTIKNEDRQRTQAAENASLEANKETAKHFILHPIDAYKASQAISQAGGTAPSSLPAVGQTITHPSGVKITRRK